MAGKDYKLTEDADLVRCPGTTWQDVLDADSVSYTHLTLPPTPYV